MTLRTGDYLTHEELQELTGCKQRARQLTWLRSREWAHETTARGEIRVLRAYRDQRLGIATRTEPRSPDADFNAFYFQEAPK